MLLFQTGQRRGDGVFLQKKICSTQTEVPESFFIRRYTDSEGGQQKLRSHYTNVHAGLGLRCPHVA